jgi:hypothetical protein
MYLHTQAWLFTARKRNCTDNLALFLSFIRKIRKKKGRFRNHTVKFPKEQAISKRKIYNGVREFSE